MDKFAIIKCYETNVDIPVQYNVIKKLPTNWFSLYAAKNVDIMIKEINYAGSCGVEFLLPVSYENVYNKQIYNIIRKRLIDKLLGLNIAIVVEDLKVKFYVDEINSATGLLCLPFLFEKALLRAARLMDKELKHLEVLIISASKDVTDMYINGIFPHVNYLTVYTEMPQQYADTYDYVYEEYGLPINFINNIGSTFVKNSDIIINLRNTLYPNLFKKSSVYFDFVNNVKEFRQHRPDIYTVNGFTFKWNDFYFDNNLLDAILYCSTEDFKYSILSDLSLANIFRVQKFMSANNIRINAFVTK